jgi:hypothetical protein
LLHLKLHFLCIQEFVGSGITTIVDAISNIHLNSSILHYRLQQATYAFTFFFADEVPLCNFWKPLIWR